MSFLSTYIGVDFNSKPLFGVEVPVGKVLYFSNEDVLEDSCPSLINHRLKPRLMELSTELVLPEDKDIYKSL